MDDIVAMQVLQCQHYAADEELGDVLREAVAATDLEPEISTGHVIHD